MKGCFAIMGVAMFLAFGNMPIFGSILKTNHAYLYVDVVNDFYVSKFLATVVPTLIA